MKESVAVIDIGSSTIVSLICEHGLNGTFNIYGKGEVNYAGFQNAEFLEPENLKLAVAHSISNAEMTADKNVYEIYVGVPGEFCTCVTKTVSLNFPKNKKISQFDVDNVFKSGNDFDTDPMYEVINKCVIYYELDGGKRVIDPIGIKSKSLTGRVSYILARKSFLAMFKSIFAELKIMIKGFVSSNLAECLYLFDPKVRDKYAVMVDIGYITTNVCLVRGNGLLFLNSFSLGGGYITSDLSECLKITFSEAERLKHKVILGWKADKTDVYELPGDEHIRTYSASATNEIVADRIEMICDYIQKCLDNCAYDIPNFLPIYITGGGFNYIRGVKQLLSAKLGRKINLIAPSHPNVNNPDLSSEVGLVNLVLNYSDCLDAILEK